MRRLLFVPAILLAVVLAGSSAVEWYSSRVIGAMSSADQRIARVSRATDDLAGSGVALPAVELPVELALRRRVVEAPLVPAWADVRAARFLYRAAMVDPQVERKIELSCEALAALGRAIDKEPVYSRALVNWANIRQILGDVTCPQRHTQGDYQSVARYALERDPTNTDVVFSVAQVLEWSGLGSEARDLFRRFLILTINPSRTQIEFISDRLETPAEIEQVVPPRFPQVTEWSRRIQLRSPELFESSRQHIARLQLQALEENRREFESGAVPAELFQSRLVELLEIAADSSVQRRLDTELEKYFVLIGRQSLTRYYGERKRYQTLSIIRAAVPADTRPLKTPLYNWDSSEVVPFDNFYQTVGFFSAEKDTLKIIQLAGRRNGGTLSATDVRLFGSSDNKNWSEVREGLHSEGLVVGSMPILVLRLPEVKFRYWKIHFASAERKGSFVQSLPAFINAYGYAGK